MQRGESIELFVVKDEPTRHVLEAVREYYEGLGFRLETRTPESCLLRRGKELREVAPALDAQQPGVPIVIKTEHGFPRELERMSQLRSLVKALVAVAEGVSASYGTISLQGFRAPTVGELRRDERRYPVGFDVVYVRSANPVVGADASANGWVLPASKTRFSAENRALLDQQGWLAMRAVQLG
jgi:hypothetical protein